MPNTLGMLPSVQPIKHPRYSYQIVVYDPTRREPSGRPKRLRYFFKTKQAAETKLRELGGVIAATGVSGLSLDPVTRRDVLSARAMLDAAGFPSLSFAELVDAFLSSQNARAHRLELVTPWLDQFLDFKVREEGVTMATRANLEARVGAWLDWQHIVHVTDITSERCIALRTRRGANGKLMAEQTRKNDMNAVSSFLSFLVKEAKLLNFNPLLGQRRPKTIRGRPRVYPAKVCQRILDASAAYKGGKCARGVGLLFLAGLRPSEVPHALIRLEGEQPQVRVEGGKMRGRANRFVNLTPEAVAWFRDQPEPIHLPTNGERRQIAKMAGDVEWIPDGARHSWVSAKCELIADDAVVARMAGTSSAIVFSHYHALLGREEALAINALGKPVPKAQTKAS